ncbi:MAG: ATP-binding protein [Hellea sp.]
MTERIEIYKAIALREKRSRQEAERLLDQKSLELYEKSNAVIKSRDELSELNSLLLSITSSSPDSIITVSSEYRIRSANRTAEQRFGLDESQMLDIPVDDIFPGLTGKLQALEAGRFNIENIYGVPTFGEPFPVEIRGRAGDIYQDVEYVIFAHDVTAKKQIEIKTKRIEQQVNEARRLEAIGTLSAGIAHEINTPIQFIGDNLGFLIEALAKISSSYQLYANLAKTVGADTNYQRELAAVNDFNKQINLKTMIKDIEESVMESRAGIKDVRDIVLLMKEFSHPGTLDDQPTDINKLILGVVKICGGRAIGVARVVTDFELTIPELLCKRGQIQQVIINLVINAIDAVEEAATADGTVSIATSFTDTRVCIEISDTGRGIPGELQDKIFDPFFTTKPMGRGTGQGLALAKNFIVNSHHGSLEIVKREGFSTTFRIELPRQPIQPLKLKEKYNDRAP